MPSRTAQPLLGQCVAGIEFRLPFGSPNNDGWSIGKLIAPRFERTADFQNEHVNGQV
jgi:hypothetical protein